MKKIYVLGLSLVFSLSFGQTIMYEGFNYTVPGNIGGNLISTTDAVGSNSWFTHSNTNGNAGTVDVVTGSLSYAGIYPSTGNKILLPGNNTATPRDINKGFASSTANVLYYSALINVVDNTQLGTAIGNYFLGFASASGATPGVFGARLQAISSGTGYRLGISNTSTGTLTYTDNPVDLAFGTTNLVVVKYDRSTVPTTATLWVNPSSLGGTEPASTITNNSGTATFPTFGGILLRNTSGTPKVQIDELKVGVTYKDVTDVTLSTKIFNNISGLSIYPNPAKNILNITSDSFETKTIAIYNVLGKVVLSEKVTKAPINIANLASGVYVIKISEGDKTASRKLVIE